VVEICGRGLLARCPDLARGLSLAVVVTGRTAVEVVCAGSLCTNERFRAPGTFPAGRRPLAEVSLRGEPGMAPPRFEMDRGRTGGNVVVTCAVAAVEAGMAGPDVVWEWTAPTAERCLGLPLPPPSRL
jgi:hypothetical protein